jgi:transglutaminase-like putative cysteine protease
MRAFSRTFPLLLLAMVLSTAPALAAGHAGVVTLEVDLSAQGKGEEALLWIPYPVSDADQLVSDVRISGDYASAAVYTDRENGTPILAARWDKAAASRKLSFSFAVERQEVRRRDLPVVEAAWNPADFAHYLQPTRLGPTDGEVKKLADRITQGQTTVLGKARAIYDWACVNMYRDPETRGCGAGDVCLLLARPGGKCADISSVYIALARAAGVPAREIFGIRLGKKAEENITTWQHCWVEFYLPGTGWIPVDPADVRKAMLTEKLTLDDPKTADHRAYFWGGIDPYRVKLGTGRDLTLNPPQAGGPVNYLMYPYAEVGGRILDWLDPVTFKYTITYRQR